jgi:hypothetical protein
MPLVETQTVADPIRQGLERLRALSPKLNEITDKAGQVVQVVEDYLNEVCHLGIPCAVKIRELQEDVTEFLAYGRYAGRYRLYVSTESWIGGPPETTQMLWANCPRELKLLAYSKIPELLTALIKRVEETIEQFEADTSTIESLLKDVQATREQGPAKKGAKQ